MLEVQTSKNVQQGKRFLHFAAFDETLLQTAAVFHQLQQSKKRGKVKKFPLFCPSIYEQQQYSCNHHRPLSGFCSTGFFTAPRIIIIYYVKVMFAHSYSENSHEHANDSVPVVQSEMTRQIVHRYRVVLVVRSTLTAQRLQSCVDCNGP